MNIYANKQYKNLLCFFENRLLKSILYYYFLIILKINALLHQFIILYILIHHTFFNITITLKPIFKVFIFISVIYFV